MKKTAKTKLGLKAETLRRLDGSQLSGAIGGVRIWKPVGFADDTTPVYGWADDTSG